MKYFKLKNKGFTMIELIIVMAISSIIAVFIALFLKSPVTAYDQSTKRAELADESYLIIKKIKQNIRMSLPNSVRTTTSGNKIFLEMLSISNGGKYRSQNNTAGTGDVLDFTIADTSFDIMSPAITFLGGEKIVVANIGSVNYDAYNTDNMTAYNGVTGTPLSNIVISSKKFPLQSVSENFYVVDNLISYVCDKDAKTLKKYWGYALSSTQPSSDLIPPLSSGSSTLLAQDISDCSFLYNQGANSRNGVVSIMLKLNNGSQSATLYGETYVPNY